MPEITLTLSDDYRRACEAYIANTQEQAALVPYSFGTVHTFESVTALLQRMLEPGLMEVRRWYAQQSKEPHA